VSFNEKPSFLGEEVDELNQAYGKKRRTEADNMDTDQPEQSNRTAEK
jgi:hypothetical protein